MTTIGLASCIYEDIELGDLEEAKENTKKISEHVGRLENLIVDILNLARADLEKTSEEPVDLIEVVDQIKLRLQINSIDNGVDIQTKIPPSLGLCISKTRIAQVLENLISNGIKYSDPKKKDRFVKISASKDSGKIEILVEDNGLGIPEQFNEEVFSMFKRFHPEASFGSGLGMYIVKKHIVNMGAEISFESSPKGSVFKILVINS